MRASYIHIEDHARSALNAGIPGDFAEIGVWHGTTFMPLAELCRQHVRAIHAVDSFHGMADATQRDAGQYQRGALSVGGSDHLRMLTAQMPNVRIHEGFVPAILDDLSPLRFAFVHLDLDQYQPTMDALRWLWPRMSPGGYIACHDWFPGRASLAAGAIAEWMRAEGVSPCAENHESHHCFIEKPTTGGL